jgi:glycine cleavage system aminomethyltransferase T
LTRKIIGLAADSDCEVFQDGAPVYHGDQRVAELVATCPSYVSNQRVGLASFPVALAYAGLTFQVGTPAGPPVRSISMPPIMPKSLSVKLDEM